MADDALTTANIRSLYRAMGGEFWSAEDCEPELRQVLAAPSHQEAGRVIAWWGGWGQWQGQYETATEWARDFRRRASRLLASREAKP